MNSSVWLAFAAILSVLAAAGLAYLGRDMWGWFLFAAVCFGGASSQAAAGRGDDPGTNATEFGGATEDFDATYGEVLDALAALRAKPEARTLEAKEGADGLR